MEPTVLKISYLTAVVVYSCITISNEFKFFENVPRKRLTDRHKLTFSRRFLIFSEYHIDDTLHNQAIFNTEMDLFRRRKIDFIIHSSTRGTCARDPTVPLRSFLHSNSHDNLPLPYPITITDVRFT